MFMSNEGKSSEIKQRVVSTDHHILLVYCMKRYLGMPNHYCCATNCNSSSHKKKNLEKKT